MVACLSSGARQASRIVAALPARAERTITTDWVEFQRRAAAAECAIVWLEWLGDADDFARVLAFRARLPLAPLVLVTQCDADNARHLKDVFVEEVVWQHEVAHELWPAVGRARARGLLARCGAGLQRMAGLPPALRRGLVFACGSPRPIHTVSALAGAVGCDRRTLWRHWHAAVSARSALALQDVLDWVLLLRARGRKSADVSWRVVSGELGVHEHTVARLAQRLVGRTLRELAEQPVAALFDHFQAWVLAPLDGPARGSGVGARDAWPVCGDSLVPRETDRGCTASRDAPCIALPRRCVPNGT